MQYDVYSDLYIRDQYNIFEFFSIGSRGMILKRIIFSPTEYPDVYSLSLGDININGQIDDYSIISNNGDRNKVLATVAYAIDIYLNEYPERYVYFTGSTKERTRLYRIAIGLNLEHLSSKWLIYFQTENGFILFEKNTPTNGFLIKRKL